MFGRSTVIALVFAGATLAGTASAGPDCGRLPRGKNPEPDELAREIARACAKHGVPTEIVKGIGHQESGLQQWRADGSFVYNTSDCGLGMMQLTGGTAKAFDLDKLKDDWRYNLDAGCKVLRDKWERAQREGKVSADPAERQVLENWYYAVVYYHGKKDESYVSKIWAHMAKRPGRLQALLSRPVEVTLPGKAIPGWEFGKKFRALPGDRWLDDAGREHKGPTHAATLGDEESAAKLEVLLARGKKALEQGKLGEAARYLEQIVALDLDTEHRIAAKKLLAEIDADAEKRLDDLALKLESADKPAAREAALAAVRKLAKELAGRTVAEKAKSLLDASKP